MCWYSESVDGGQQYANTHGAYAEMDGWFYAPASIGSPTIFSAASAL
ncbi:MAG: hypothetical protein V4805_13745 [Pseudomonadota bacterium]